MLDAKPISPVSIENLDLTIRDLVDQVQVLREVLDETRVDLQWATHNDRLIALPISAVPGNRD